MDYDLSFVSSNGEDISNIISNINEVKRYMSAANEKMVNNWFGLSYNNYIGCSNIFITRCDEKINALSSIINLLGLIAKHNKLRIEREECYAKISSLRPYEYTVENDDYGNEHKILNEVIHSRILGLKDKIEKINLDMDIIISNIRSITGG